MTTPTRQPKAAAAGPSPGPNTVSVPAVPFIAAAILLGTFASLATRSMLPTLLASLAAMLTRSRIARARMRAATTAQRSAVVDLCAALRGELQAGRQPSAAFAEAVWCRPELRDLAEAVTMPDPHRSAAELLAEAAHTPGRNGLTSLAACWRAAEVHGVSLTGAVSGIEDGLRAEQARRQNLAMELSGVRTTVALLGVLPIFGLALGSALGADPVHTLLSRPAGEVCLAAGCLLELAGLRWTDRLVGSVESTLTESTPNRTNTVRSFRPASFRGIPGGWTT
ncbi:MAG TPA: hypothetical protein VGS97_00380 [Actinocrinis sp.]|uniref:type II secretion system F family protein n=1 Tax=Actinocrinis sp. TaxID=1920516 RepID=UPI002DDDA880|nr:hypothetical protein [Actinocrinis sp.]HEV2342520.1 hypothetical protein [Actinocrinis sp.]